MVEAVWGSHDGESEPSPAQRRLWLIHQFDASHPAYNICLPMRLRGPLNMIALAQAIALIERRHSALRSRFVVNGTKLRVRYRQPGRTRLQLVETEDRAVGQVLEDLAGRPFDLEAGPLARWTLVRAGAGDHVLTLTVHHIVFDGGSLPVLCDELQSLVNALCAGARVPATAAGAAAPGTRADSGQWTDEGLRYWREHLADPPPPLSIWLGGRDSPSRPRAITTRHGIEPDLAGDVQAFARRHSVTPFVVLLAALAATLHRYTGREDLVVGSPVSLRETTSEPVGIGLMLNLIPLRLCPTPGMRFDELVAVCRDAVLGAIDHRNVPFELIVDSVRAERSASFTPLFQVLFAYQRAPEPPRLPGVASAMLPSPTPAAKYALTVTVTETSGRPELALEADAQDCDQVELSRFTGYLTALLRSAVAEPTQPLGCLPMRRSSTPANLAASVSPQPTPTGPSGLAALFAQAVRRWPDRIALHATDCQLSYAGLDRKADRLARRLRVHGAGAERIVGVCLPRTADLLVALLAVAKTGSAYLPLDPRYPVERLRAMAADAGPVALVTTAALGRELGSGVPAIHLDTGWEPSDLDTAPAGPVQIEPSGLAYVLYTSGSTGVPKGVALTQENVTHFLAWAASAFSAEDLSATVALTSTGFDLSVFELFAPMAHGGTVVLVDGPERFSEHPGVARATLLNTVPSVVDTLLDAGALPPSLRAVNLAGEPLPRDLVDRLLIRRPGVVVRNLYGPSEATTYVTAAQVRGGARHVTIGQAVAGAQIWLCDEQELPVPPGVTGQLLVGGTPLARGYLHRPALTASAFRPDGSSGRAGARLYHTGDLVRQGHDGDLRFLGRADQQVKVRGVRIELEEIETLLRRHPSIRDAAVVVSGGELAHQRLVAYVCADPAAMAEPEELTVWLRQRLPEVMVPSGWVVLDRLPRSANGKLDRRVLARTVVNTVKPDARLAAPRSTLESELARVWCDVLGVRQVGVHEPFFDAGGNSLLLIRLHGRLKDSVGVPLTVLDLFRWPTIAALAGHIERLRHAGPGPSGTDETASSAMARGAARRGLVRQRTREPEVVNVVVKAEA